VFARRAERRAARLVRPVVVERDDLRPEGQRSPAALPRPAAARSDGRERPGAALALRAEKPAEQFAQRAVGLAWPELALRAAPPEALQPAVRLALDAVLDAVLVAALAAGASRAALALRAVRRAAQAEQPVAAEEEPAGPNAVARQAAVMAPLPVARAVWPGVAAQRQAAERAQAA
jgi:hypothetical protein